MDINKLIEVIVKEVIEKVTKEIYKQQKKALVLFTGGKIGFETSLKNIRKLINDGWKLKVVLSKNADFVLGFDNIKRELGLEDIFVEGNIKDINYLKKDIDKIIIPVLTINSASKISLGISDTLITYLVSWGIMKGIPIVAAKDACDPENNVRLNLGLGSSTDYNDMIKKHLKKLESYNIKFTSAEKLYDDVIVSLESVIKSDGYEVKPSSKLAFLEKRLITTEDVIKAKEDNCEIIVSKDTIVTALAKDMAQNMGVNIKNKGGF